MNGLISQLPLLEWNRKPQPAPRLPSGDRRTVRWEAAVFACLALTAAATISLTVVEASEFVAGSGLVRTALAARFGSLAATAAAQGGKMTITNTAAPVNFPREVPARHAHPA